MTIKIASRNRKLTESIFISYCALPIPKKEIEYDAIVGSILGMSLEILHSSTREKAIRILTKKYQYHKYEFKKKQDFYFHVGQILSDIWRYRSLWLYTSQNPPIKRQRRLTMSRKRMSTNSKNVSLRESSHTKI